MPGHFEPAPGSVPVAHQEYDEYDLFIFLTPEDRVVAVHHPKEFHEDGRAVTTRLHERADELAKGALGRVIDHITLRKDD
jgi:hypothetical protein